MIVDKIGYESETLKSVRACFFIFIMLYFNTGWLTMLADANFKNQNFLFSYAFRGASTDFDMQWQEIQGVDILIQMSFNIFMPLLYEFGLYIVRVMKRLRDKRCCRRGTRCTSKMEYIQMYQGPEYLIHFKYAL